jgi:hypothetical protein
MRLRREQFSENLGVLARDSQFFRSPHAKEFVAVDCLLPVVGHPNLCCLARTGLVERIEHRKDVLKILRVLVRVIQRVEQGEIFGA